MKHLITTFLIITQFLCFQSFSQKNQILENMKWRNIGPDRGGRSLAVSGSSSRLNEYYFGAVGGVYGKLQMEEQLGIQLQMVK